MMLSRTAVPMSRASMRILIARSSYPIAKRGFHMSYLRAMDSKASFATIAPEKSTSTTPVPPTPQPEDKTVVKVAPRALTPSVHEKRDFHWSHPVYTREEYETIQVPRSSDTD